MTENHTDRLEYLRGQIRAESISYGEIAELQGLAEHIDPGDVELLEWAGVPEFPEDDHHDNRYEDGEDRVYDADEGWIDPALVREEGTAEARYETSQLPSWIRIVYVGPAENAIPKPPVRGLRSGSYAVEIDSDFGPVIHFRGTLRECAVEAVKLDNWDGPVQDADA